MLSAKINIPDWLRWTLFASIFVVAFIGVGAHFWSRIKVRKIKQKYQSEEDKKNQQKLQQLRGEDLGTLPYDLKKFFASKSDDYDVENLINTVFLNNSQEVLFVSAYLEFELATILIKTNANVSIIKQNLDINLWNNAVLNFPQYFSKKINIKTYNEFKQHKFNLIFASNLSQSNLDLFEQFYSMLQDNAMLIIRQDKQKNSDLKNLVSTLKLSGITYEVSSIKSQFIYIVKRQNN
ncbi:hypothetical protein EG856_02405 [Mycoplasmopsis phocirhinis]|uniref:Uncharacterized protein n=1 Tax=Mycoplasmopsis phocirhinis TaxID=142650 RepID=A0A4P6MTQ3_9BACT|nr:hypothetical protein [Mycoplasmopsis phocirhinis]QBF34757.1 hypothetical protein EG856_02405 [Mycoplasmopsis phocirhinis]